MAESNSDNIINVDPKNADSIKAFAERHKKVSAFSRFSREFTRTPYGYVTTVDRNGSVDKITLTFRREESKIQDIDLNTASPVKFKPTKHSIYYYRERPEIAKETEPVAAESTIINGPAHLEIIFNPDSFDEDETWPLTNNTEKGKEDSQEAIHADLQRKFADLGLKHINISAFEHRLIEEDSQFRIEKAHAQADLILPLYRQIEVRRLLELSKLSTDSNLADYSLELVKQRQYLYEQITHLLHESGMTPVQITRYLMEGLYDETHIAGLPVFTDEQNDHYVIVDYALSGYDELDPDNRTSDFAARLSNRPDWEVDNILSRAREKGYQTRHYKKGVMGGIHQETEWYGIRIDNFDKSHPEKNFEEVVKILKNVGLNPEELIDLGGEIGELVIKETGAEQR